MKHYAGIDLSMETSHVCVVDAEGRKLGAAAKPASSQCNVRPCETRYSTAAIRDGRVRTDP